MNRIRASLLAAALLYGYWVSGNEAMKTQLPKLSPERETETRIVASLYAFARNLENFDEVTLQREYRRLILDTSVAHLACQQPHDTLRLVMLLSGVSPHLEDFDRARQLLKTCSARSFGLLLNGYVHAQLANLDHIEDSRAEFHALHQALEAEQKEQDTLVARIRALENELWDLRVEREVLRAKIQALTTIEQNLQEQEQQEVEQHELQQEMINE